MKHYKMSTGPARMSRTDGTYIHFADGYFSAESVADQEFLDNEITSGHPYLSQVDESEVPSLKKQSEEQAIREALKEEIRAQLLEEMRPDDANATPLKGITNSKTLKDISGVSGEAGSK